MQNRPRARLAKLFTTFLVTGVQSFGGGSSTLFLIHQACIRNGWLDEEEFVRVWALVQISPGINLMKLVALIGYRLDGWPGLISAVSGMLLPSALVTVLMTAGFTELRDQPLVKAAMKGILPATLGLSLAMAVQMGQPLLTRAAREGRLRLGLHVLILISAALLLGALKLSPVVVLLLAGAVVVLLHWRTPVIPKALSPAPESKDEAGG